MNDLTDKIRPIVMNAKPAEDHIAMVKTQHDRLVDGINQQSMRVQAYNQNQELEKQNQEVKNREVEKENTINSQKDNEFKLKNKELDIKKFALSQP